MADRKWKPVHILVGCAGCAGLSVVGILITLALAAPWLQRQTVAMTIDVVETLDVDPACASDPAVRDAFADLRRGAESGAIDERRVKRLQQDLAPISRTTDCAKLAEVVADAAAD